MEVHILLVGGHLKPHEALGFFLKFDLAANKNFSQTRNLEIRQNLNHRALIYFYIYLSIFIL